MQWVVQWTHFGTNIYYSIVCTHKAWQMEGPFYSMLLWFQNFQLTLSLSGLQKLWSTGLQLKIILINFRDCLKPTKWNLRKAHAKYHTENWHMTYTKWEETGKTEIWQKGYASQLNWITNWILTDNTMLLLYHSRMDQKTSSGIMSSLGHYT